MTTCAASLTLLRLREGRGPMGDADWEFAKRGSLDGGLPPIVPVESAKPAIPKGLARGGVMGDATPEDVIAEAVEWGQGGAAAMTAIADAGYEVNRAGTAVALANLLDLLGDADELRAIGERLRELDPYWREAEDRRVRLARIADAVAAARGEGT
jgi:hypothetical protein